MITKKTEHSFYTITLDYNEGRQETGYEKELIRLYVAFIEKMQEKLNTMKRLKGSYYHEELLREEVSAEFEKLRARYVAIDKKLKEINNTHVLNSTAFTALRKDFFDTLTTFVNFHKEKIVPLWKLIDENQKMYTEMYNWFEAMHYDDNGKEKTFEECTGESESIKMYSEFNDYSHELYQHYEKYSLDSCRFFDDVEAMKEVWRETSKEWDAFHEYREEVVKGTAAFSKRINATSKLSDKINKQLAELEVGRIAGLN